MLKSQSCLCGVHISTGTKLVAICGLVFHGLYVFSTVFIYHHYRQKETEVAPIIRLLNFYWLMIPINLLLLLGSLYKKPLLYWPYLISMSCILLIMILLISAVVCFGSLAIFIGDSSRFDADQKVPIKIFHHGNQQRPTSVPASKNRSADIGLKMQMFLMLSLISSVLIGITVILAYMLSIVFRDYRFLKAVLEETNRPNNHLELYEQKY